MCESEKFNSSIRKMLNCQDEFERRLNEEFWQWECYMSYKFLTNPVFKFCTFWKGTKKKTNKQNQNSTVTSQSWIKKLTRDWASETFLLEPVKPLKAGCQQICQLSTLHIWIIKVLKHVLPAESFCEQTDVTKHFFPSYCRPPQQ